MSNLFAVGDRSHRACSPACPAVARSAKEGSPPRPVPDDWGFQFRSGQIFGTKLLLALFGEHAPICENPDERRPIG